MLHCVLTVLDLSTLLAAYLVLLLNLLPAFTLFPHASLVSGKTIPAIATSVAASTMITASSATALGEQGGGNKGDAENKHDK